jgi:hypothetical protein
MNQRGPQLLVTLVFSAILLSASGIQLTVELRRGDPPQLLELFRSTPTRAHLRTFEETVEDDSVLASTLRPWMQYGQFLLLNDPGDKALLGPHGWFFYKQGVEYVTQHSAPPATSYDDPTAAICDFRDQLATRGIRLLVIPVPNKESVYPRQLSRRAASFPTAVCGRTQSLLEDLQEAGVEMVNLFELFGQQKALGANGTGQRLYLAQDSHWSPAGLELAAQAAADRLLKQGWVQPGKTDYEIVPFPLRRVGDVLRMLDVPQIEHHVGMEQVCCYRVLDRQTRQPYRDQTNAQILVLGDSFLRIFQQDEPMAAGFIAHLASRLRQPVSSIVNDGGGSTLVRQDLFRRPELLQDKKVVIWEFVERDIRFGAEGWQLVPLPEPAVPGDNADY